jgi:hypothetical protein
MGGELKARAIKGDLYNFTIQCGVPRGAVL